MKNKKILQLVLPGTLLLFPVITLAEFPGVISLINDFTNLVRDAITVVFAIAMLYFVWNMSQVVLNAADSKAKEEHRQKMIWGIIGMFVMFSLWGIITWLGDNFDVSTGGPGDGVFQPCPQIVDPPNQAPGC